MIGIKGKAMEVKVRLVERIRRIPSVESFRFTISKKVDFIPGQFMEVIFDKNKDRSRHFLSFSSSPTKDYIEFTKRISSSEFSQKLEWLKAGDKVLIRMPLGSCVFRETYKKLSFIKLEE